MAAHLGQSLTTSSFGWQSMGVVGQRTHLIRRMSGPGMTGFDGLRGVFYLWFVYGWSYFSNFFTIIVSRYWAGDWEVLSKCVSE